MRIIQIASLVTPNGAYGGPIRVAVNQSRALRAAGHEVELVAAASGFDDVLPQQFDGVPIRLFPARLIPRMGFSGTYSPQLRKWLKEDVANWDIAHIHMGRDLVTLSSAILAKSLGTPYFLQTHGMIAPSRHPLAGIVDRRWTIPALLGAQKVLFLTPEERDGLNDVADLGASLEPLANGVPPAQVSFVGHDNEPLEVLFLARLHKRKRPLMFVELARKLHSCFPNVHFVMVGPDGGEGGAVREGIANSGISHVLRWEGALSPEDTSARISRCSFFVLPSINEPFPMSVLEALSLGKPCVVTTSCGLAPSIESAGAGAVVDETLESLVSRVSQLLSDEDHRRQAGIQALTLARTQFGMDKLVERLEQLYIGAAAS